MTIIKLLAAAGDWAAGDVVRVPERQAQSLIRTGYAEAYAPEGAEMGLTGAKRKQPKPERTH